MLVVVEVDRHSFQSPEPLDVHLVRTIHQDVRDLLVFEERLQGTITENIGNQRPQQGIVRVDANDDAKRDGIAIP